MAIHGIPGSEMNAVAARTFKGGRHRVDNENVHIMSVHACCWTASRETQRTIAVHIFNFEIH